MPTQNIDKHIMSLRACASAVAEHLVIDKVESYTQ